MASVLTAVPVAKSAAATLLGDQEVPFDAIEVGQELERDSQLREDFLASSDQETGQNNAEVCKRANANRKRVSKAREAEVEYLLSHMKKKKAQKM